jgi:hypothetical protein
MESLPSAPVAYERGRTFAQPVGEAVVVVASGFGDHGVQLS